MAKYKPSNEDQMVMLPISLQDQLVPGTLEHTINRLVDENIDLSVFDERYNNDVTGAAAIHPKLLLKVILLAYAKGMISSRQIERACHENILFIALSYGYAPDHSTIAAFVSSMQKEISSIFSDILTVCDELDLLGGTHFSLDGVKLSANVSKEWSGTLAELKHKRDKLQEKLQRVMEEHAQADQQPQVEIERQKKRERRFENRAKKFEGVWKTYTKFTAPQDVAGTQFLVLENKGDTENDLHLYEPIATSGSVVMTTGLFMFTLRSIQCSLARAALRDPVRYRTPATA